MNTTEQFMSSEAEYSTMDVYTVYVNTTEGKSDFYYKIIEKIMTNSNVNRSILLSYIIKYASVAYAEDIVILTRNVKKLREVFKRPRKVGRRRGNQ